MRAAQAAPRRPERQTPVLRSADCGARRRGQTLSAPIFAAVFLIGYLAGIPLGRTGDETLCGAVAGYYMDANRCTAFLPAWGGWLSASFLQVSLVFLCGFHLWGNVFLGLYFAGKGAVMGFCAAAVYAAGGTRALIVHWLLNCLPDLGLFLLLLWLANNACRACRGLRRVILSGSHSPTAGELRRLCLCYLAAAGLSAAGSVLCAGSGVLIAGALL